MLELIKNHGLYFAIVTICAIFFFYATRRISKKSEDETLDPKRPSRVKREDKNGVKIFSYRLIAGWDGRLLLLLGLGGLCWFYFAFVQDQFIPVLKGINIQSSLNKGLNYFFIGIFVYQGLRGLLNSTTLRISSQKITIHHGPLFVWKSQLDIDLRNITEISYSSKKPTFVNSCVCVKKTEGTETEILSTLTQNEAIYFSKELNNAIREFGGSQVQTNDHE